MDQAEQLRLRVNQQNKIKSNSKVISVTSGKGGVGKTSLSVNLAIQMAKKGKRVIIIDADFGLANVEVMLGIRPQYNLSDLIYHNKTVQDIMTPGPMGIQFISGGSGVQDLINFDKTHVKMFISKLMVLDSLADIVIIDTGAGISDSVLEFVLSSPQVLLVVTPEPTSITDAYSLLKAVNRNKDFDPAVKKIQIVANRVTNEKEAQEIFSKLSLVAEKFLQNELVYMGCVLQDMNVSRAIIEQKPVSELYPSSSATKGFLHLANRILEEPTEETQQQGIAKVFLNFIKTKRKTGR